MRNNKTSVEAIARVAYEAYRAWCAVLGDTSQPPWEDAPDWQRESAMSGVLFLLDNPPAAMPAQQAKDRLFSAIVYALR